MMGTSFGTTAGGVWNQLLRRATWGKGPGHNEAIFWGCFAYFGLIIWQIFAILGNIGLSAIGYLSLCLVSNISNQCFLGEMSKRSPFAQLSAASCAATSKSWLRESATTGCARSVKARTQRNRLYHVFICVLVLNPQDVCSHSTRTQSCGFQLAQWWTTFCQVLPIFHSNEMTPFWL